MLEPGWLTTDLIGSTVADVIMRFGQCRSDQASGQPIRSWICFSYGDPFWFVLSRGPPRNLLGQLPEYPEPPTENAIFEATIF